VATDLRPVRNEASIEEVLKTQLTLSTVGMTVCMYPAGAYTRPLLSST
jgi:inorganic pyrophosphatase